MICNVTSLTPKNEIFGVSGSPRKNGNSDILLKSIISGVVNEDVAANYCNLKDIQFQGCIGCERCRKDKICTGLIDGMSLIYNKIVSSKGLVLVSPTHNYNVTSWMKAFIDRLYCFYNFKNDRPRSWSSQLAGQGRKAVIAAICEQETKEDMGFTIEAMRKPLEALGYEIVGELSVFRIFDKAKVTP
jgi:multimeric flavodoxin WrbA